MRQVLTHPWIAGSQAAEVQLNGVLQQMRLSQNMANTIIKRGFLTKQGKIVKNWKRRSFVLTEKALQYFEDDKARDPKGTISVADIDKVCVCARAFVFVSACVVGRAAYLRTAAHCGVLSTKRCQLERRGDDTFVVGTKDRDYILQAASVQELEGWMKVLTPAQQCAELLHKATVAKNAGRVGLPTLVAK